MLNGSYWCLLLGLDWLYCARSEEEGLSDLYTEGRTETRHFGDVFGIVGRHGTYLQFYDGHLAEK